MKTNQGAFGYRWSQVRLTMMDLLFPPQCAGCGTAGTSWCKTCQKESRLSSVHQNQASCTQCGQPESSQGCVLCADREFSFNQARSFATYAGPLAKAVKQLKYSARGGLGDALAIHLIDTLQQTDWTFDWVLPVPLGAERRRTRGFNQAAKLSEPVAAFFGLAQRSSPLIRVRDTQSQVGLDRDARLQNVKEAFRSDDRVAGHSVVVIDDVFTTGSTLDACARALKRAGAQQVYSLTLARASGNQLTEA